MKYKYILRLEGECENSDSKRDIAEYDSPDEAVKAGLFYINEANEFLGDVKSEWMLLESNLKDGTFVAKRDMPDSEPCIFLRSVKVEKKINSDYKKEADKKIIRSLVKTSNYLKLKGFINEANLLNKIIYKIKK